MGELTIIRLKIQENVYRVQSLRRIGGGQTHGDDPNVVIMRVKMHNCCDEIMHVKELQVENEGEIVRLKELLAKRDEGYAVEVKYILVAVLVVLAALIYLFK